MDERRHPLPASRTRRSAPRRSAFLEANWDPAKHRAWLAKVVEGALGGAALAGPEWFGRGLSDRQGPDRRAGVPQGRRARDGPGPHQLVGQHHCLAAGRQGLKEKLIGPLLLRGERRHLRLPLFPSPAPARTWPASAPARISGAITIWSTARRCGPRSAATADYRAC